MPQFWVQWRFPTPLEAYAIALLWEANAPSAQLCTKKGCFRPFIDTYAFACLHAHTFSDFSQI